VKVLLWNQNWFASELKAEGHAVVTMGYAHHLDVVLESPMIHIDNALAKIPGGWRPDLIIVHDNSAPLGLDGLDTTDIPTIFYSVDTHHHCELHIELAKVFDATFVAQRDYMPAFEAAGLKTHWLPLWLSQEVTPVEPKQHGAVFVGTLNRKLNPDRVSFFEALQKEVPILCTTGFWPDIFARSEIVINQTVKGDLNFRVFEAMGSGALLLTEASPNGLFDLFREGEHLVTYSKGNVQEAAARIRELLDDKERIRRIAASGRAEIFERHLAKHRLAQVLGVAETLKKRPRGGMHLPMMVNFSGLGRRMMRVSPPLAAQAFSVALKHADDALMKEECLAPPAELFLVSAAIHLDQITRTDSGHRLLERYAERYPNFVVFRLAAIRRYLNTGRAGEARDLAQRHFPIAVEEVFKGAEGVIQQLLEDL
jgi:hypothetical protein